MPDNEALNRQLMETQKQYYAMYLEKLMHAIPMGKAIIETIEKNGRAGDFNYMYTASKTIVQSLMTIQQSKAIKSIVDMVAGVMCRYMHERVIVPMLQTVVHNTQLRRAYQAYQASVNREENDAELEMRCLLHCIHEELEKEKDQCFNVVNPFKSQLTQHMKAVSEYVVALLVSVTEPVRVPERKENEMVILHAGRGTTHSETDSKI
ncbi:hypothetical protein AVEN_261802-1 [Araneus ventricosus]|uniref:Uncharacterized protein n=1 Tax=Araneus ventricosus TaxID=182803 RepID=A0A4Y2LY37_ARAVE|nr:hypothetical protein AVEN_261802-1 [Araneus ventricosus]